MTAPVPDEIGGGRVTLGRRSSTSSHIGAGQALEPGRCAGYLAKYATKATEQAGGVLHPVAEREVDALPVREHVRRYLRPAFALDSELPDGRLARNAHAFGYRGHCLTKRGATRRRSRRCAGARGVRARAGPRALDGRDATGDRRGERAGRVVRVRGAGHFTAAEEYLARSGRVWERERRRIAWEERFSGVVGVELEGG